MLELQIFELLSHATLVVKLVLVVLLLMSLGSWAIIFTKMFTLSSAKRKITSNMESFQDAEGLRSAIKVMGRDMRSPAYLVAVEGVNELNRMEDYEEEDMSVIMDNLRRSLRQGVSAQLQRLSSSLSFLATCANAAPFIGLFGTVWGIMHSFHAIAQMKTAALAAVAPGISEALVATAIGLAVAIPATMAYNFFLGRLNYIEAELVNFAGVFLNRVQRELPHMDETQQRVQRTGPRL
jgi:biopolymer transport protein TolQ